jgi:hypothetical protein
MATEGQEDSGTGSVPQWAREHAQQILQFNEDTAKARDYGTIVVYHRWIDENLTAAIKTRFVKNVGEPTRLLMKYPGGLSSFSARVHLGRCLGILGPITYGDLKTINDIRNDSAHPRPYKNLSGELEIRGFDNKDIAKLCAKLKFLDAIPVSPFIRKSSPAEYRYCNTAYFISQALWMLQLPGDSIFAKDGSLP